MEPHLGKLFRVQHRIFLKQAVVNSYLPQVMHEGSPDKFLLPFPGELHSLGEKKAACGNPV